MNWERAASRRLTSVAGGAFVGFLCFILRRLNGIACFLCGTDRAAAVYSWGHHVLLIGIILQLLLHIRNVERGRINHSLRYVLVRFDVTCIYELSSLCSCWSFPSGNSSRSQLDLFFGRLRWWTHKFWAFFKIYRCWWLVAIVFFAVDYLIVIVYVWPLITGASACIFGVFFTPIICVRPNCGCICRLLSAMIFYDKQILHWLPYLIVIYPQLYHYIVSLGFRRRFYWKQLLCRRLLLLRINWLTPCLF